MTFQDFRCRIGSEVCSASPNRKKNGRGHGIRKNATEKTVGPGGIGKRKSASLIKSNRIAYALLKRDGIETARPRTRAECGDLRPCPFVSCIYHTYLDVGTRGTIKFNQPRTAFDKLEYSCALDVAEEGEHTLEFVAHILSISRERVRQLEHSATRAINKLTAIDPAASSLKDYLQQDPPYQLAFEGYKALTQVRRQEE